MADEWLILAGALGAGFALGALTVLVLSLARRRRPKAAPPPPAAPEPAPADHEFSVVHAPSPPPRPVPVRAPPTPHDATIPLEWAERALGQAPTPGRARGVCSGCGTAISVSMRRPVRVACPECGNTRLLG